MGLLRRKRKNSEQPVNPADKSVHRTFQFGALFLLGIIVYSLYFDKSDVNKSTPLGNLTQEQLNERVKQAFENMANGPEYKQVKDFVLYIETNIEGTEAKILKAHNGVLVYIPEKMLGNDTANIKAESENLKISIVSEKKPQAPSNTAAESQSPEVKGGEKPADQPAGKKE